VVIPRILSIAASISRVLCISATWTGEETVNTLFWIARVSSVENNSASQLHCSVVSTKHHYHKMYQPFYVLQS
jgi:hypothetical protein